MSSTGRGAGERVESQSPSTGFTLTAPDGPPGSMKLIQLRIPGRGRRERSQHHAGGARAARGAAGRQQAAQASSKTNSASGCSNARDARWCGPLTPAARSSTARRRSCARRAASRRWLPTCARTKPAHCPSRPRTRRRATSCRRCSSASASKYPEGAPASAPGQF